MTATSRTLGATERARPEFNCPTCDRPALVAATDELVTWRCGSCGQRVTETGGEA
jgi:transcription elongation factor Elf1